MKTSFKIPVQKILPCVWMSFFMLSFLATSCDGPAKTDNSGEASALEAASQNNATLSWPYSGNLVEVKTEHMNILMPEEIPSGWNTFRYRNESQLTHLISLDKMPVYDGEQKTLKDLMVVVPVFQDAMDLINDGKVEEGFAEFARFPEWFSHLIFTGGVGLVSAGETAQTTVYLEPGLYVAECYVKTAGVFHPMQTEFRVMENSANASPPIASLNLTISKEGGIEGEEEVRPGLQTIAVHFKDQAVHENFMGHDVNLVRLDDDTDMDALNTWMNWADPKGLETPAPATFLGGAQQMPAGNTAYFTVELEPGRYAWISEVPDPSTKGMLKTFTVPVEQQTASREGQE